MDSGYEPVAIVGLGCRLPGEATSPSGLWRLLSNAKSAHGKIPRVRFNADGFYHPDSSRPGSLPSTGGYFLTEDVRTFDNEFFGINNVEATYIDPQQRKLLEIIYECLENGGQTLELIRGSNTGVFIGNFTHDFSMLQFKDSEFSSHASGTGAATSILANRVSHVFDLHGPSFVMDTACSSSLYAVHAACRALHSRGISAAIVASANLIQSPEQHLQAVKAGILSPDSTCHTFDSGANGYGRAEGVNALFLKRLDDAINDNDPIRAVIRGTSVNSNGKTTGISLPNAEQQEAVIRKAYQEAKLDMNQTQYVEAHGTGTPVGDPIEVEALARVFGTHDTGSKLMVGSIKTNLGHSEGASGISSILKVTQAMEKGYIPPTVGIKTLNPRLEPFLDRIDIVQEMVKWPKTKDRRAGINSFGFGGANAHVILDSWNHPDRVSQLCNTTSRAAYPQHFVLPLSAHSKESLEQMTTSYKSFIQQWKGDVKDLVYTLTNRRTRLQQRCYALIEDSNMEHNLSDDSFLPSGQGAKLHGEIPKSNVFVFTGQGAQWVGMAAGLIGRFPVFADTIIELDQALAELSYPPQWKLSQILDTTDPEVDIADPAIAQPICTALQIGVINLLKSWDVTPGAVIGHSSGEIAAAFATGCITAAEAISIAYYRGFFASQLPGDGAMLAVGLSQDDAQGKIDHSELGDKVRVACINSPQSVTLSGDLDAIEQLENILQPEGVFARQLRTKGMAYHSHHMLEIGALYENELRNVLHNVSATSSSVLFTSTVTGSELELERLRTPRYWRDNLESPVQFAKVASQVMSKTAGLFIEIGPHTVLKMPLEQTWSQMANDQSLAYSGTLVRKQNAEVSLLKFAGDMFVRGMRVSLDKVNGFGKRSVVTELPLYPWNHNKLLWNESRTSRELRERKYPRHYLLGSRLFGGPTTLCMWRNVLRRKDIPWLQDHSLQGNVVFPGAGYVSLALEGIRQYLGYSKLEDSVKLRNINIMKALIIPKGDEGIEIVTTMSRTSISARSRSKTWLSFEVFSVSGDISASHATGEISIDSHSRAELRISSSGEGFKSSQTKQNWYEKLTAVGLEFGPTFTTINAVEHSYLQDQRKPMRARAVLESQDGDRGSMYAEDAVHPTFLDALFQTSIICNTAGDMESLMARVPTSIDDLWINVTAINLAHSEIYVQSEFRGFGTTLNDAYAINDSNEQVIQVRGLRLQAYDTVQLRPDLSSRKPILRVSWKPDIELLGSNQNAEFSSYLSQTESRTQESEWTRDFRELVNVVVHKHSDGRLLAILDSGDELAKQLITGLQPVDDMQRIQSLTFADLEGEDVSGCLSTQAVVQGATTADELNLSECEIAKHYDLVIGRNVKELEVARTLLNSKSEPNMSPTKYILISQHLSENKPLEGLAVLFHKTYWDERSGSVPLEITLAREERASFAPLTNASDHLYVVGLESQLWTRQDFAAYIQTNFQSMPVILNFDLPSIESIPEEATVIFTVDLDEPILRDTTPMQMQLLQNLFSKAKKLLWLTRGDFLRGRNPEASLAFGLSRALMLEQPALRFALMDLELTALDNEKKVETYQNSMLILSQLESDEHADLEYVQSNGMLYCSRFVADEANNVRFRDKETSQIVSRPLGSISSCQLQCQSLGQFDTLFLQELEPLGKPLQPGYVEVKTEFVSLNYKDLAVMFSAIDTTDGNCALEFSGIVNKVASAESLLKPGDRVVVMAPMKYNRFERVPEWACVKLQDNEDPKEMATYPLVFSTAIHALHDIAKIQRGESILIHCAAGSLGQAAIQLAQSTGAEIFVTVGTEEKRDFVANQYGIERSRIFASRNSSFVEDIMNATNGEGVDVVLDSLREDLLHASVQCCAPFGRFIEVGRRDIIESGKLDMSVFNRNISFTAVDLSHFFYSKKRRHNEIWSRLLHQVISLYRQGEIGSRGMNKIFGVSELSRAFESLQSPERIGKIVVDFTDESSMIKVLPRKYETNFDPSKEYILVGGLGGLGRSLSTWMIQRGAKRLTFLSRSGRDRQQTKDHIRTLTACGADVQVIRGSVNDYADVAKAIDSARGVIGGVVHAAMGLDEALFASMSSDQWLKAIYPKVHGAWNLHRALEPHEKDLDFFLITSSINGCVGTATESNYCAANNFLDSFARYRRVNGLKATAVGLGMISEVGYLHEHPEIEKLLLRKGVHPINQSEMLAIIDIALQYENEVGTDMSKRDTAGYQPGHLLTGLEMVGLTAQREHGFEGDNHVLHDTRCSLIAHNFARLSGEQASGASDHAADSAPARLALEIQKPEPDLKAAHKAAVSGIKEKISNLLLVSEDKLDESTLLSDYGMDSMLAAEFRGHVFKVLKADVPFMTILGAQTKIKDLADIVVSYLISKKPKAIDKAS